jgi:WD40-like Beta Propeller Repeat
MKPVERRITLLLAFVALVQACTSDKGLVGPAASKKLTADAVDGQPQYGPWSAPVNLGPIVNSAYNDQHPSISKDERSLYFVSNRPGGFGGNDIWVTQRATVADAWGPPHNLGPSINTSSNDFAPDLTIDGHHLYMNSDRPGGCGGSDLYVARRRDKDDDFGWTPPVNLGCTVNTIYDEAGPTFFEDDATRVQTLYFTSFNRPGGFGDFDIYVSTRTSDDEAWGPGVDVTELNGPYRDTRTAIRRDGLEMFISSDATSRPGGVGGQDLWVSTRATTADAWSTPVNLGPTVNSTSFDGAPALSFDGTTLYFFSARPGGFGANDLYVTTRARLNGADATDMARVAKHR